MPALVSVVVGAGAVLAAVSTAARRSRHRSRTRRRLGSPPSAPGAVPPRSGRARRPRSSRPLRVPTGPLRWWRRRRSVDPDADLPEILDLLRLAHHGLGGTRLALAAVATHGTGPLAGRLGEVDAALRLGAPLEPALQPLRAVGPGGRALADALVRARDTGAPLDLALDRLAGDARRDRARRREAAVRSVPVKLLFPLVLCTLPGFGLLTVVPLLARALPDLG